MLKLDIKGESDGNNVFRNYIDGIKNSETKRKYTENLEKFLNEIPNAIYLEKIQRAR